MPLYRRVVHPEHPGLFFIGLLQPLGAIMPLAEAQSEWIADSCAGEYALPSRDEMAPTSPRARGRCAKRYVASKRHTIQVDFDDYMRELERGARGRPRACRPAAAARPRRCARRRPEAQTSGRLERVQLRGGDRLGAQVGDRLVLGRADHLQERRPARVLDEQDQVPPVSEPIRARAAARR